MQINDIKRIRELYENELSYLIKDYPRMNVNSIIEMIPMNTIERMAWMEIRKLGLPMLPQFPIGKYFADFADPIKKIVIEIDGKEWHDASKDMLRDKEMNELGYEVIRFEAKIVAKLVKEYSYVNDDGEYVETVDEFVETLKNLKEKYD